MNRNNNNQVSTSHDVSEADAALLLSPISSQYSSCGESEFDRYCSANSVMATPSLCGSSFRAFSDSNDFEFESLRSFGIGDELSLDNLSLSGRVSNKASELADCQMVRDVVGGGSGADDGNNVDDCAEEASSRGEYSGGEDSGYEDGLIREVRIDRRDWYGEEERENVNPLVMGTSEAYGLRDWDDFVENDGVDITNDPSLDNPFQRNESVDLEPNSFAIEADIIRSNGSRLLTDSSSEIPDVGKNTSESEQEEMEVRDIHLVICQPLEMEGENVSVRRDHDEYGGLVKESGVYVDEKLMEVQSYLQESHSESEVNLDPLSDTKINHVYSTFTDTPEEGKSNHIGDRESEISTLMVQEDRLLNHAFILPPAHSDHMELTKIDSPELNESLDDFVTEMEEILMDAVVSPRLIHNQGSTSQLLLPSRDDITAASTSNQNTANPSIHQLQRIDGVEVVGAMQRKGDVSLGERLVGVKEYTVYRIRVWSGNDSWEVDRRYRDFCTLYRRLKAHYADRNLTLPSPWSSVDRESRKIFGSASPDVVAERSILIQECLTSVLNSRVLSSSPSAFLWFLSPKDSFISTPKAFSSGTATSISDNTAENNRPLGKTISLIVENKRIKSVKQQLETQHYTCAGCHQYFDEGKTVMLEIIHTLGWGKPRLCEYSGQLFCHSCHTNDTSVLPARVLHQWDFTEYPVSQMAKSYLDAIHDQPMLCVSAVNPFLFSKVPSLLLVMNIRKKIGAMLPYLRCPFRRTINNGLGPRRYLLDSNDFFSLRDLIDLSRGPFSALPVTVETISRKILEHITEQCLFCCDVGVVCGAKQSCSDPMSLVFPFQDTDVKKCRSCGLVFHEPCFKKLTNCPCEAHLRLEKMPVFAHETGGGANSDAGALNFFGKKIASSISETISGLLSKTNRKSSSNNVILMGSMPRDSV